VVALAGTTHARLPALSFRNLVADYEASHFDIFSDELDDSDHEQAPLLVAPLALCPLAPFVEAQLHQAFAQFLAAVSEASSHVGEAHDCWRRDSDDEVVINCEELPFGDVPAPAPEVYDVLSNITVVASALVRFRDAYAFAHGFIDGFDLSAIETFTQDFTFAPGDWNVVSIIAEELGINECLDRIEEIVERLHVREDMPLTVTMPSS